MNSRTTWWWVRHGPTDRRTLAGWTDVPTRLTDSGAIARLAAILPAEAAVISSDLCRAIQTADAVGGSRPRMPNSTALRELNFGDWEGLSTAEISDRYPETAALFWCDPRSATPPRGEQWNDLAGRVSAFVDRTTATIDGRDIIAVAHFGTILTQIERTANSDPGAALASNIQHLSVTRIEHMGNTWNLVDSGRMP